MKVPRIVAMLVWLVLSACGGGSGDTEAPVAAQQYVDGIWEGTLGDNESFAIINATPSGSSSDVHVAKKVSVPSYPYGGTSPYDIVQGLLSVRQNRLTGTSFTYQDVQAFDSERGYTNRVTLSGTAVTRPGATQADQVSGVYSQPVYPVGVMDLITYTDTPINLRLSRQNNFVASLTALRGLYRGGVNGSSWSLTINGGLIAGNVSGCAVLGRVSVHTPNAAAASKALFDVSLSLGGTSPTCTRPQTEYSGLAFVMYDTANQKTGLRLIAHSNSVSTLRKATASLVLDGQFMSDINPIPIATSVLAEGFYVSTDAQDSLSAVVLPNNQYVFYRPSSLVLLGDLRSDTSSSAVASVNGIYYNPSNNSYTPDVYLMGDVRDSDSLGRVFTGYYNVNPTSFDQGLSNFSLRRDTNLTYTLVNASPSSVNLAGTYNSNSGFASPFITSLVLRASGNDYVITGNTQLTGVDSANQPTCVVNGRVTPYALPGGATNTTRNIYSVTVLRYDNCEARAGLAPQSGVLFAEFSSGTTVNGVRLLTYGAQTGTTNHTVFYGVRQ